MTWYERLPKVELHVHLEGAVPHGAMFELIRKYGGDPSVPDLTALVERFTYKDFDQFIAAWSWKNRFLREYEDFSYIAEQTATDMARQNIRYAEMFFSPSLFIRHGLDVQKLTYAVRMGVSRVRGIRIALIADLVRDYGPEREMKTLRELNNVKDQGVIGIGIGGSEHMFPPEPFQALYAAARNMGFRTTVHAGEVTGPESVWEAIRCLRPDRIGHATRAWEDARLIDYLAEHRIPLELCPMSNVRTGVVPSLAGHPIGDYFKRGLIVSVNTDDPKMFATSLAHEYRMLEQACGFSKQDIRALILQGVRSSWLPEVDKQSLAQRFRKDRAWEEAPNQRAH